MEAGPAHAAGVWWMIDKLKESGGMMARKDGSLAGDPSIFSPMYQQYLERYLQAVIEYLVGHEHADAIYGYSNGCEWWYPHDNGYSPLAAERFRDYLEAKYGQLDALNARWGTEFLDWDAVLPPLVSWEGIGDLPQAALLPDSAVIDACYCTTVDSHVPVQPGQRVTASVEFTAADVRSGQVMFEIAWLNATEPTPIHIDRSTSGVALTDGTGMATLSVTVPENAARAWLLPKCRAAGRVTLHEVSFTNEAGEQLAPNPSLDPDAGGWHFINWRAGEPDRVANGWDETGQAWISYEPVGVLASGAEYPLAEVYDWQDFRSTAFAGFIGQMATWIKEADDTRPVVSYLTIGFANAFEWDNAQQLGMELDHIARLGEHIDVLGMQLAGVEGDYDSVTCAFDMMRKYDRPMWAVDLLDFTRGVALGQAGLTRLSQSVVQHGGSGIQYYCWFGTEHYNYSTELGLDPLTGMIEDVRRLASQVADAQPICQVALVMPRMPMYAYLPEPANDWADFMGWYKLLVRLGVCPDVYTLEELADADLSGYKAVIVPDCAYVLRDGLPALAGAKLVTSGRFATRDMSGREIARKQRPKPAIRYGEPVGTALLGDAYRQKPPTNVPPRLVCRDGGPEWDAQLITQVTAHLRKLGVDVLADPMDAPVTVVPFEDGDARSAFVLPDREWSGQITLRGRTHDVDSTGLVVTHP
jgi:hypothetical protein